MIPQEVKIYIKKIVKEEINNIVSDLKTEIQDLQTEMLIQKEGDNI